jgi:hypothetical protein
MYAERIMSRSLDRAGPWAGSVRRYLVKIPVGFKRGTLQLRAWPRGMAARLRTILQDFACSSDLEKNRRRQVSAAIAEEFSETNTRQYRQLYRSGLFKAQALG